MRYIPEIFQANEYGDEYPLGSLPDAISCKVTEERNGEFYCEMTYPADGQNADLIQVGRYISVKAYPSGSWKQYFRINTIAKTLEGTMDITAYHISYDLSSVIVTPFTANNLTYALEELYANGSPASYFHLEADFTSNKTFAFTQPTPLRNLLVGTEGSIVDTYGGELKFDGWNVILMDHRGTEKNVQIAYGKNLREFTETDEIAPYDTVYPFAIVNETLYTLTDGSVCPTCPVVKSSVDYDYPRTIALDLSENYPDTPPSQAQLLAAAQSYINGHSTSATANYATGFVDLRKILGSAEEANLCDTIYLTVTPYNIRNIKLKVIRTVYDALLDEYESVEVGDKKVTLADELAKII